MQMFEESRKLRREFEAWISEFRKPLWDYCLKLTRNVWDAEDLFQDTLLKSFSQLNYLYQAVTPKSYLFRMATNHWLNTIQKQKRSVLVEDKILEKIPAVNEGNVEELQDGFQKMADRLTELQQAAFILTKGFGFTNKEAGEFLLITEGAVKSLLKRAKDNLLKEGQVDISRKVDSTKLMNAYMEAFNQKDPDRIASLLNDQATMDIVGVSQEYGKAAIRKSSLQDWSNDPVATIGEWGMIDGAPAILAWTNENTLYTVIRIVTSEEKIVSIHDHYFSQELQDYLSAQFGRTSNHNGTFWEGNWVSYL